MSNVIGAKKQIRQKFCTLFCHPLIFFKIMFFKNTIRVSNSLEPDPTGHFVRADLGPKYLQRFSTDNTRR